MAAARRPRAAPREPRPTPAQARALRRLFSAWVRREGARIARRMEATHRRALVASARRAAREYFDHAWAQTYFFVQTLEGWTRLTDPRAIVTVLNDRTQVVGRDYLWVSAAPVLVIEWQGELRMMTAADLAARIAELERDGTDGAATVGLRPLPSRQRH